MNNRLLYIIFFLIFLIGFLSGIKLDEVFNISSSSKKTEKLSKIFEKIDNYYLYNANIDSLIEKSVNSIVSSLDEFTYYLSPEEQKRLTEEISGKYLGIGIEFLIHNNSIYVSEILDNSPAKNSQLLIGDIILSVNGIGTSTETTSKVISEIKNPNSKKATLKILRKSENREFHLTLEKSLISLNSINIFFMIEDSIGYIKLDKFVEKSFDETENALEVLRKNGLKRIIIDIRNNPGGLLEQACKITDLFLSKNQLIVSTYGKTKEFNKKYYTKSTDKYEHYPLVVLVNSNTASAGEIFTAAIKDWKRGKVVGENTYGKGVIQLPYHLYDDSELRLTVSYYKTPSGERILHYKDKRKSGIKPDLIVSNELDSLLFLSDTEFTLQLIELSQKLYLSNRNLIDTVKTTKELLKHINYSYYKDTISELNILSSYPLLNKTVYYLLLSNIAKIRWGNDGYFKAFMANDNQLNAALKILKEIK